MSMAMKITRRHSAIYGPSLLFLGQLSMWLGGVQAATFSVDDGDSRIDYRPQGAWVQMEHPDSFNHTLTSTFLAGATATLKFNGTGIAYYGSTNMTRSFSNVFLDGQPTILNTQSSGNVNQVRLFQASNLDPDVEHSIAVVNTGGNSRVLNIDYFTVCETFCPEFQSTGSKLTSGAIAGIVLGVLAFVSILLLLLLFYCVRRFRRQNPSSNNFNSTTPSNSSSPFRPISRILGFQADRDKEKKMMEKKRKEKKRLGRILAQQDRDCLDDETECLTANLSSPLMAEHNPGETPVPSLGMVMAGNGPPMDATVARLETLASRNRLRLEDESRKREEGLLTSISEHGMRSTNGRRLYDEMLDGRPSVDSFDSQNTSSYYSNGGRDAIELPTELPITNDVGNPYAILNRDLNYGSGFRLVQEESSHSSLNVNTSHPQTASSDSNNNVMMEQQIPPLPSMMTQGQQPSHMQPRPSFSSQTLTPQILPHPPSQLQQHQQHQQHQHQHQQPHHQHHSQSQALVQAPRTIQSSSIRHLPPTPEMPRPSTQPVNSSLPSAMTPAATTTSAPPMPYMSSHSQNPQYNNPSQGQKQSHDYPYFPPHSHSNHPPTHPTPPIYIPTRPEQSKFSGGTTTTKRTSVVTSTPQTGSTPSSSAHVRVLEYQISPPPMPTIAASNASNHIKRRSIDGYQYPQSQSQTQPQQHLQQQQQQKPPTMRGLPEV